MIHKKIKMIFAKEADFLPGMAETEKDWYAMTFKGKQQIIV